MLTSILKYLLITNYFSGKNENDSQRTDYSQSKISNFKRTAHVQKNKQGLTTCNLRCIINGLLHRMSSLPKKCLGQTTIKNVLFTFNCACLPRIHSFLLGAHSKQSEMLITNIKNIVLNFIIFNLLCLCLAKSELVKLNSARG